MHFHVVLTGSPCKLSGSISAPARKNLWQISSVPPREFQAIQHRRNDVTTSRSLAQGNALAGSREEELWASSPPLLESVGRNKKHEQEVGQGTRRLENVKITLRYSCLLLCGATWHIPASWEGTIATLGVAGVTQRMRRVNSDSLSLPMDSFPHSWQQGAIPIIMGVQFTENESEFPQISLETFPDPKFALLALPCEILAPKDFFREEHKKVTISKMSLKELPWSFSPFLSQPL